MKIKTICINLEKSVARRESASKLLGSVFDEYYFFNAISGADINVLNTPVNNIKLIEYFNNYFLHDENSRKWNRMSYGEFGCALSHYILYNQLANDSNYDAYLICEDDITVTEHFNKSLLDTYFKDFDNVKFDYCPLFSYEFSKENCLRRISNYFYKVEYGAGFSYTTAYVITKNGAKQMVEYMKSFINVPSDTILTDLWKQNKLDIIIPEKPLFTNDSSFIREIWNIYKKDEDYRNVVWDKAVVINSTKYDLYSESRLTHIIIKK